MLISFWNIEHLACNSRAWPDPNILQFENVKMGIILHHSTLILINSYRKAFKFLGTLRTNFLQDVFFTVRVLHVVDKILPFFTLRKTEHRRRTKNHVVWNIAHQTFKRVIGWLERDWNETVTQQILSFYLRLRKNKMKWQDCSISTKNNKVIPSPMFNYHSLIP